MAPSWQKQLKEKDMAAIYQNFIVSTIAKLNVSFKRVVRPYVPLLMNGHILNGLHDILATSHGTLFTGHKGVDKNHKKYILCMTDICTQYVELVTLPKKEAETITDTIFSHWICQLGIPVEVITDLGKEFCNKLTDKLFQLMEIKHGWTSALVQHSSRSGKQDNC